VPAVTFVSTNPGKFREVRDVLAPFGVTVRWERRTLPEPQADELSEVVNAKLDATRGVRGYVLVEDSGLFIPSLKGFPGVYSAHILALWGFDPILELLRHRDRHAFFRTVAGLRLGSTRWQYVGEVHGVIARRPAGGNGFGYDPIFIPDGWDRTFAEAAPSEKNELSHRARAIRQVGESLRSRGGPAPKGRSQVSRRAAPAESRSTDRRTTIRDR
jgi:XTP/dITP diphosphohydrolase